MRFALILLIVGFFPIFLLISLSVKAKPTVSAPVVVELFTSQSCSSCPPADKLLGELAKSDDVIALSCHVTYWNHLHWKDTLSQKFCTDRQRSYVNAMQKRTSYTPQMVVNGRHDVVGNRSWQVTDVVKKSKVDQEVSRVDLRRDTNSIIIDLPTLNNGVYKLTLLKYTSDYTQAIPSGENRGRTVQYTNPVTDLIDLGSWDGRSKSLTYEDDQSEGYAILIHAKHGHGPIVAAGKI